MKTKKACLLVALVLSFPAEAAYRCIDEKGRTHIGDTPPAGCANVIMYEVTKGGKLLRRIDPTMTEEQAKARAEAEEKARLAAKAAAEQKRKDMALLSTSGNEKEFDTARDRNIEPLQARIKQSGERIKDIDKRIVAVKEEMEFYGAGKKGGKSAKGGKEDTSPMASELDRLEDEKKTITKNIAGFEREIVELRIKYESDKRRWVALKQGSAAQDPKVEAKTEPKVEAKAEPVKVDAKAAKK